MRINHEKWNLGTSAASSRGCWWSYMKSFLSVFFLQRQWIKSHLSIFVPISYWLYYFRVQWPGILNFKLQQLEPGTLRKLATIRPSRGIGNNTHKLGSVITVLGYRGAIYQCTSGRRVEVLTISFSHYGSGRKLCNRSGRLLVGPGLALV